MPSGSAWGDFIHAVLEAERVIDQRRAARGSIKVMMWDDGEFREAERTPEQQQFIDSVTRHGLLYHVDDLPLMFGQE